MKIECPECGQHYEVDSNDLDRHFRCTECKTFFLGLNAKAVKVQKFVPKNSVEDEEKSEETADDAKVQVVETAVKAEVVEAVAPVKVAAVPVVKAVTAAVPPQAADKKSGPQPQVAAVSASNTENPVRITRDSVSVMPTLSVWVEVNRVLAIAAVLIAAAAAVFVWLQREQIEDLKKENIRLEQKYNDVNAKTVALAPLADKLQQSNEELERLHANQKKDLDAAVALVREDAAKQFKSQEERFAAVNGKIEDLTERLDELTEKIKDLPGRRSRSRKR